MGLKRVFPYLIGAGLALTSLEGRCSEFRDYFSVRDGRGDVVEIDRATYTIQRELVERAIRGGWRENSMLIVVSKLDRRLDIYLGGRCVRSFPIDLSWNAVDDKVYEDDFRTPEGLHYITEKLTGGDTEHYKALIIDYPNPLDVAEFNAARREGRIPSWAKSAGKRIAIHGDKRWNKKKRDWTRGCVALRNGDIDYFFKMVLLTKYKNWRIVRKGTPVVIVKHYEKLARFKY